MPLFLIQNIITILSQQCFGLNTVIRTETLLQRAKALDDRYRLLTPFKQLYDILKGGGSPLKISETWFRDSGWPNRSTQRANI